MRQIFLSVSLWVIMLVQNSMGSVTALSEAKTPSRVGLTKTEFAASNLMVSLSTATGKKIVFKTQEQREEVNARKTNDEIPHLVLNRNGVLTPGFERTLVVSVDNLPVHPSGMYVQLVIETQHGDPDLDPRENVRIRVWKEIRFIPHTRLTQQGVNLQFKVTFDPMTKFPHKTIETPTDYYRCRIVLTDPQGNQLQTYVDDFAFLMENQLRVPLPKVLEATPGAAPDELLVYYYDMIPFQSDSRDPDSRIPRQEVDRYIRTELIPQMVKAFETQSNLWNLPWYQEWSNYRADEAPKTLSVALGSHGTWFHGAAPSLGHAMISIRVDGTFGEYSDLTQGIMSVFHHELFHNQQRNISLHYGSKGLVDGQDGAWKLFSEGTAVLASSIGQPQVQFARTARSRSYLKRANAFLGSEGAVGGGLNKSLKDIPYHTALYWRFLYESCGGVNDGKEEPAIGMQVIRRTLETLYKGEITHINSSTDVAPAFPRIIDLALQSTPSCKYQSYEESLIHFARAVYMLRLEDGRCSELIQTSNCGFIDPYSLYQVPPAESYFVAAGTVIEIHGSIPSSYGIDLNELVLDPAVKGQTLKLTFRSAPTTNLEYHVELWKTRTIREDGNPGRRSVQMSAPVSVQTKNGSLTVEIPDLGNHDEDGLGLIIIRTDPNENMEATGTYSIQLIAE